MTGANFEQAENSDGKAVFCHNSVLLPDGRLQNVKYTADHFMENVADVSYEGLAVLYQAATVKGSYHTSPAHKHVPVYHPAPMHNTPIHEAVPLYHG